MCIRDRVIRSANPARAALVRSLVSRLDRPTSQQDNGNIHVVYLRNADATQLAVTLRAAMSADPGFAGNNNTGGGASTGGTSNTSSTASLSGLNSNTSTSTLGSGSSSSSSMGNSSSSGSNLMTGAAQPSTGGMIQADPANNALIISAPAPLYRQMRAVIDQLDTRRAQVYVEAVSYTHLTLPTKA